MKTRGFVISCLSCGYRSFGLSKQRTEDMRCSKRNCSGKLEIIAEGEFVEDKK